MQVKKFEAKTMKEAWQLVKQELGPEAIILSAKDNKKSFGLAGRGSVEITAAISERSLQKKKYVENQMPQNARDQFRTQSARRQKEFIEEAVNKLATRQAAKNVAVTRPMTRLGAALGIDPSSGTGAVAKRPVTSRRYIDIGDEEPTSQRPAESMNGRRVDDILEEFAKKGTYVLEDSANVAMKSVVRAGRAQEPAPARAAPAAEEVQSLRKEVETLRELLGQFGKEKTATRHPGAEYGLPFELSANYERLQNAGVDPKFIVEILEKADKELSPVEKKRGSLVDAWVGRYVLSHTTVSGQWLKNGQCQAHLFVGPGGFGKTSVLVKMASQLSLQERKRVAVVTTDTYKVGAVDQLKIYCQILNLPFETARTAADLNAIMQRYRDFDAVLIDYPGLSLKEMGEIDRMRALMPAREIPKQTHLVLSCASKDIDAYEACHRYQMTHFDDIIVTKLDESFVHGFLFNIQRKVEKPLYAFGIGQKMPEDIELATRERVLDLIFKITKNNK